MTFFSRTIVVTFTQLGNLHAVVNWRVMGQIQGCNLHYILKVKKNKLNKAIGLKHNDAYDLFICETTVFRLLTRQDNFSYCYQMFWAFLMRHNYL